MDIGSSNVCIRFVGIAGQSCYSAAAPASSNELLLPSKSVLNAEGAVRRCAQALNIDPIRRHLFGLFDCNGQFWLAPNQSLTQYAASGHYLEFRLRLFPYQLQSLKINSTKEEHEIAFNYLFNQVRNDFLKSKHKKFRDSKILGCMVTDITRYILERKLTLDKALDQVDFAEFLPVRYREKRKRIIFFKTKEIEEAIHVVWHNSHQNLLFVKEQYIESIIGRHNPDALLPEYTIERYAAQIESYANGKRTHSPIEIGFFPYDDSLGLAFRVMINATKDQLPSWQTICVVQDLCFLSVQETVVEVSRKSGSPVVLQFAAESHVKSFVSLLDGYYRLSEKWAFSLCKEISTPYLAALKTIKCHGPIGFDFAQRKLQDYESKKVGTYLLRESATHYDQWRLDLFICLNAIKTFRIVRHADEESVEIQSSSGESLQSFGSLADLCKNFVYKSDELRCDVALDNCLPPSEYDHPNRLLLCNGTQDKDKLALNSESSWPRVVPSKCVKLGKTTWKKNNRYTVRLVSLKLKNDSETNFVLRQINDQSDYKQTLDRVNDLIAIKSDVIVKLFGITSAPFSLLFEYLPIGPLDDFLKENRTKLNLFHLAEISTYAAKALYYLDEINLVHGRIRCRQFLVHSHTDSSIKVKLSDPFGECDVFQELAWFPPEFDLNGSRKLTGMVDVWSFGTTLWEIFSYGEKPKNLHVAQLCQPFACDPNIWELVKECRYYNHEFRKKPQAIMRDIHQMFYDLYNTRNSGYTTLDADDPLPDTDYPARALSSYDRGSNNFFKSIMSLSKLSLDTNTTDLSRGSIRANSVRATDSVPEPWIIEANQLVFDNRSRMLGEGYYGEVLKATLTSGIGLIEEVAVKRIKNTMHLETAFQDLKYEIKIMTELHHQNIVQIKGFVEEPQIMLVMEYVEFGSLSSYLKMHRVQRSNRPLPLLKYAADICSGMHYLEYKNVLHRDLAARNILVASESQVKISDFGLARSLENNEHLYRIRNPARNLPIKWYAPESLLHFEFTHKSDVWSFGVTLWEMYSYGDDPSYPIGEDENMMTMVLIRLLDSGVRLRCPDDCPNEMYRVMSDCWKQLPVDRPSFSTLQTYIDSLVNQSSV